MKTVPKRPPFSCRIKYRESLCPISEIKFGGHALNVAASENISIISTYVQVELVGFSRMAYAQVSVNLKFAKNSCLNDNDSDLFMYGTQLYCMHRGTEDCVGNVVGFDGKTR